MDKWLVVVGVGVGTAIIAVFGGMGFWVMAFAALAAWALLGCFIVRAGQTALYMRHLWEVFVSGEIVVAVWTASHMEAWKPLDVKAAAALIVAILAIALWRWLNWEYRSRRSF